MTTGPTASDFPQRLRQLQPISTLEDLQAAAFGAAELVCAGNVDRAQAVDDLYGIATAAGLTGRYGDDAVQASISAPFAFAEPPKSTGNGISNWELDERALAQTSVLLRVTALTLEGFLRNEDTTSSNHAGAMASRAGLGNDLRAARNRQDSNGSWRGSCCSDRLWLPAMDGAAAKTGSAT